MITCANHCQTGKVTQAWCPGTFVGTSHIGMLHLNYSVFSLPEVKLKQQSKGSGIQKYFYQVGYSQGSEIICQETPPEDRLFLETWRAWATRAYGVNPLLHRSLLYLLHEHCWGWPGYWLPDPTGHLPHIFCTLLRQNFLKLAVLLSSHSAYELDSLPRKLKTPEQNAFNFLPLKPLSLLVSPLIFSFLSLGYQEKG